MIQHHMTLGGGAEGKRGGGSVNDPTSYDIGGGKGEHDDPTSYNTCLHRYDGFIKGIQYPQDQTWWVYSSHRTRPGGYTVSTGPDLVGIE